MAADWTQITDEMTIRTSEFFAWVENFKEEMTNKIEKAKNDEILSLLTKMSGRLDRIEEKVFEEEADEASHNIPRNR